MHPIAQFAIVLAATFVGVSMGHSLIRGLFGGGRPAPAQVQIQENPCQYDVNNLSQCIQYAHMDISKCQIYMDNLKACQSKQNLQ